MGRKRKQINYKEYSDSDVSSEEYIDEDDAEYVIESSPKAKKRKIVKNNSKTDDKIDKEKDIKASGSKPVRRTGPISFPRLKSLVFNDKSIESCRIRKDVYFEIGIYTLYIQLSIHL